MEPLLKIAGALEDLRQQIEDRGRVALLAGRFAGGKADFALGHGEAGDGIHDEQDALALVAEVLGDGEGDEAGADAQRCGAVGAGDDEDAALAALLAELVVDEGLDLAVAFADEGDDGDVGRVAAAHGAEQRALADARAAEDADALADAAGQEAVDDADAGGELLVDVFAREGIGRGGVERIGGYGDDGRSAIHGEAEPVEDAAEQERRDGDVGVFVASDDGRAELESVDLLQRNGEDFAVAEADHLGADLAAGAGLDFAETADGGGGAVGFDEQSDHGGDLAGPAEQLHRLECVDVGTERERAEQSGGGARGRGHGLDVHGRPFVCTGRVRSSGERAEARGASV